jgi:hypothetical protein
VEADIGDAVEVIGKIKVLVGPRLLLGGCVASSGSLARTSHASAVSISPTILNVAHYALLPIVVSPGASESPLWMRAEWPLVAEVEKVSKQWG